MKPPLPLYKNIFIVMAAPPRFLGDVYATYTDDDSIKEVWLQAQGLTFGGVGDRHVLLWWRNGDSAAGSTIIQVIQLSGQAGNYNYYSPVARKRSQQSSVSNLHISLGLFSRAQRDQILQLAKGVEYNKASTTNGCRVWTRDLLEAILGAGLLSQATFTDIDTDVPLVQRVAEN